jgi:hypothetical protein
MCKYVVATILFFLPIVAHAQDATIRGEGLSQTVDCADGPALVEGNGNRLTFRGRCTGIDLRGNGNSIRIELGGRGRIHVEGNGNHFRYAGSTDPRVEIRGEGDTVSAD